MHMHTNTCTQIFTHTHTLFLTLDAVGCTKGDLWGWLPLVLCVSDLILWFPLQTSTQHTDTERQGVGMEGSERDADWKREVKGWRGESEKAEIGKKTRRGGGGESENDWDWSRWKGRLKRWWRETARVSDEEPWKLDCSQREILQNKEHGTEKKTVNVVCLCVFVPVCVRRDRQPVGSEG